VKYGKSINISEYTQYISHPLRSNRDFANVGPFIAQSTNKTYIAAHLALLTSFSGLPRTLASASTGYLIEALGYPVFFLFCTVLAIPGMVLLFWIALFWKKD
jgi:predicted MFS family arabinose efflux permease